MKTITIKFHDGRVETKEISEEAYIKMQANIEKLRIAKEKRFELAWKQVTPELMEKMKK